MERPTTAAVSLVAARRRALALIVTSGTLGPGKPDLGGGRIDVGPCRRESERAFRSHRHLRSVGSFADVTEPGEVEGTRKGLSDQPGEITARDIEREARFLLGDASVDAQHVGALLVDGRAGTGLHARPGCLEGVFGNAGLVTRDGETLFGRSRLDIGLSHAKAKVSHCDRRIDVGAIALRIGDADPGRALAAQLDRQRHPGRGLGAARAAILAGAGEIFALDDDRRVGTQTGDIARGLRGAHAGRRAIERR